MAFILTHPFAAAYQAPNCNNPFGGCGTVSRPTFTYRVAPPRPQRQVYSPFHNFFNEVDELLSDINREAARQAHLEAQREAHRQRQQRKRALRAKFAVNQTEQGWQVDGDIQGFEQENITIEVSDEHTLTIAGNTELHAEPTTNPTEAAAPTTAETSDDKMDGVTLNEPDAEAASDTATLSAETASHQATVEDDFEDLGAETSSLISSPSRPASPTKEAAPEPKGKEPATTEPTTAPAVPAPEAKKQEERPQGSFTRTFRFPERIDGANVQASFKDGVLTVLVPRAAKEEARRIAIL